MVQSQWPTPTAASLGMLDALEEGNPMLGQAVRPGGDGVHYEPLAEYPLSGIT